VVKLTEPRYLKKTNMKNSTLLMVGIAAAVAMFSAGLAVVPTTMQQASAQDTTYSIDLLI
jgi:hypothetical protein